MASRSSSSKAPKAKTATSHARAPQQVRIIGGQYKRTPLPVVDADGLRPTSDRVRETVFNWLGQDLTGWRCADLFAGTGALGLDIGDLLCRRNPAPQRLRCRLRRRPSLRRIWKTFPGLARRTCPTIKRQLLSRPRLPTIGA